MTGHESWYRGKYPPTLIEALATHSLLLTLGYTGDEIFMSINKENVVVILQAEGRKAYLRMGSPELSPVDMAPLWKDLILEWNTGGSFSKEEKDAIYEASQTNENMVEIVTKLFTQGFQREPLDRTKLNGLH